MRSGVSDVECARGRAGAPLGEGLVSTSLTKRGTSVVDLLSPGKKKRTKNVSASDKVGFQISVKSL